MVSPGAQTPTLNHVIRAEGEVAGGRETEMDRWEHGDWGQTTRQQNTQTAETCLLKRFSVLHNLLLEGLMPRSLSSQLVDPGFDRVTVQEKWTHSIRGQRVEINVTPRLGRQDGFKTAHLRALSRRLGRREKAETAGRVCAT